MIAIIFLEETETSLIFLALNILWVIFFFVRAQEVSVISLINVWIHKVARNLQAVLLLYTFFMPTLLDNPQCH